MLKEEILVRIYNVGCGDCIFIRIPDNGHLFHILIDCGNYIGQETVELEKAMNNVEELLNDKSLVPADQRGHLDLLVATHQHWDHIKGFESSLEAFKRIKVDRIWLTVGMKEDYPQASQLRALQDRVEETLQRIKSDPAFNLSPDLLSTLNMLSLSTKKATEVLTSTIPCHHGIKSIFVYRGFENELTKKVAKKVLLRFKDPQTKLAVLAPEKDIDTSYVKTGLAFSTDIGVDKQCFYELVPEEQRIAIPTNISLLEFHQLKPYLKSASLVAALQSGHIVNNTSVVLLLEWKGRRLIFPGDAEQESWKLIDVKSKALKKPIDFLKVSHHGSCTGTPFDLTNINSPINIILESILPEKNANQAKAVVSTLENTIKADLNPVPHPDLMKQLAKRICNTGIYPPQSGKQPQRTDKENKPWIDITIKPKNT
jgi:beta-lactamase superfamily II metal-dependent hydrolase